MYCHYTINVFTASMNYWTDNEHRNHKQATKKKPYTNNRYSFKDKHVEIVCESMESFINTRQNKTYWSKDLARQLHGALACERQTHFRSSLLSLRKIGSFSIDDGNDSENFSFKMNFPFFQTLLRLFQFAENGKCRRISLELISWGPHSSLEREKEIRLRLFTSSIKLAIRHFHVVVVQGR